MIALQIYYNPFCYLNNPIQNCKNHNFVDLIVKTQASRVDKIQELHLFILHHVCEIIEKKKP